MEKYILSIRNTYDAFKNNQWPKIVTCIYNDSHANIQLLSTPLMFVKIDKIFITKMAGKL